MSDDLRGDPKATSKKELRRIFRLAKVTKRDVFCDLGCGHGNLCRWAIKKVSSAIGTEDDKQRFKNARSNTKKFENVKILNENYRAEKTLRKLRQGTIFYCTNELDLGFYRKFERIMKPETRLVTFYFPPYPVKPNSFDGWYYLAITPFRIAKTKKEWLKSVTKKGTVSSLVRKIKRDFDQELVFSLEEGFDGIDWIRTKNDS
jgi:hypothetical protein